MVKINDPEKFKKACEKMKYFDIEVEAGKSKSCRALPFDKELLGTNRQKLADHNLFIRKVPTDMKA
jgi:hypothetical protein